MKTSVKKVISIILLFAVLATAALNFTVSARYKYIDVLTSSCSITSKGLAESEGTVWPSDDTTKTTLTVELQKKSGSSWVYEDSWSASGTGTNTVAKYGAKYVVRGTYRAVVTAKIYSSGGSLLETQSCISHEMTY